MKQNNQYTVQAKSMKSFHEVSENFTGSVYASNKSEAKDEADKWAASLSVEKGTKIYVRSVERTLKTSTKSTYRPSKHF